jgi:hypothetical protein
MPYTLCLVMSNCMSRLRTVQLLAWRKKFRYLRVEPSAVIEFEEEEESMDEYFTAAAGAAHAGPGPEAAGGGGRGGGRVKVADLNLCVSGRRIGITAMRTAGGASAGEAEEEVLAQHGIIEEVLEYDAPVCTERGDEVAAATAAAAAAAPADEEATLSPTTSMREEVIASIFDALWPDVVQQLGPLLERLAAFPPESIKPSPVKAPSYQDEYGDSEW